MCNKTIPIVLMISLSSCHDRPLPQFKLEKDSVSIEQTVNEDVNDSTSEQLSEESKEYEFRDQLELNEASYNWYKEYFDKIEAEYQQVISSFPNQRKLFEEEKTVWEKYMKIVREVADYEDHGSSTSMYIDDMMSQGVDLRKASIHDLYLLSQKKRIPSHSKTRFTSRMIDKAYKVFIEAEDYYVHIDTEKKPEPYKESIRKEQRCWKEWMTCRQKISSMLPSRMRKIYDNSTNLTMRTKLHQLKNQNQCLGMFGHEVMECVLPDSCSDKALLNYPGFNIIWAKHCENTDWYPTFE